MTLKTTKEQRDALLIKIDDPDFTVYNSVVRDLCHDADMAEELEKELIAQDQNVVDLMNQVAEMSKDNAELRGRIKHYERAEPEAWKVLREENTDLRAKLEAAYERAAMVCEQVDADGEGPDCWDWHAKNYAKAIRALKGREQT